jgi:hypothetical protein
MCSPNRHSKPFRKVSEWNTSLCPLSSQVGNLCSCEFVQRRASQRLTFRPGICQTRLHSFSDQRSFELCNCANHLEHEFSTGKASIDGFRYRNKIDPKSSAGFESRHELLQGARKSVELPNHDDIDRSASTSFHKFVQSSPIRTGSGDALVPVDLLKLPAATLNVLSQCSFLRSCSARPNSPVRTVLLVSLSRCIPPRHIGQTFFWARRVLPNNAESPLFFFESQRDPLGTKSVLASSCD